MKKVILGLLVIALAMSLNAQEKGKIRVGFDGGLAFPNAGIGIGGGLDVRYNIQDNINAGVILGGVGLIKDVSVNSIANTMTATASAINNYLITSDYYFNNDKSSFAPFLGGGIGISSIQNIQMTVANGGSTSIAGSTSFLKENRFGALLRGGFEAGHFRMTAEYHLIGNSNVVDINKTIIGTTGNSYFCLNIGFYIGGGYWRKILKN